VLGEEMGWHGMGGMRRRRPNEIQRLGTEIRHRRARRDAGRPTDRRRLRPNSWVPPPTEDDLTERRGVTRRSIPTRASLCDLDA